MFRVQGQRTRVLFVDDEEPIGSALAQALESTHELVLATSAAAAQTRLAEDSNFDAVVCDLMMPETSGAELHRWMREQHPQLAARTLFITGGRIEGRSPELAAIQAFPCLWKPFTRDAFRNAVADLVARTHA